MKAIAVMCALVVVACSSDSKPTGGAQGSSSSDTASKPKAANDAYPAWAAAIAPEYPSSITKGGVADRLYQIDTADDPAAVLAWYKQHATGTWIATDPDADQSQWNLKAPGGTLMIQKNNYWKADQPSGPNNPKTMIALQRK
jgi:hypothetical protein